MVGQMVIPNPDVHPAYIYLFGGVGAVLYIRQADVDARWKWLVGLLYLGGVLFDLIERSHPLAAIAFGVAGLGVGALLSRPKADVRLRWAVGLAYGAVAVTFVLVGHGYDMPVASFVLVAAATAVVLWHIVDTWFAKPK